MSEFDDEFYAELTERKKIYKEMYENEVLDEKQYAEMC